VFRPYRRSSGKILGAATWYEFVVQQFNKANFDYGLIEQRRQTFLEATVKTPYFWYSFSSPIIAGCDAAYTKLYCGSPQNIRIAAEIQTDLHNHDLLRQAAREATRNTTAYRAMQSRN